MFATRKDRTERTAAQAWDHLSAAMAAAGETARDAGRQAADAADRASGLAGRTSRRSRKLAAKANRKSHKLARKAGRKGTYLAIRAGGAADEAWTRANAAAGALAGRKPGRPWGLITGVGLLGLAAGWVAASTARAALERQAENEQLELAETAVVVTPTFEGK
ncbi:hypothetical protein [Actinoplanes teichomyceticus]|uniref:Uncharacterized protein n=1 Tax=Actinoplanes teichomyceticus TaxID=1867 RepID=A0A561WIF2_ACTTI|nr:hypothetical protein [Actinoplanes teichomyceticus]TWG23641.1 hypothetical protein FHX34_102190 [Actinoplanes teichomyceticus]GIF11680.1 hypothetical protein Ate01nite_17120 [Actinoplanes teichomyceticus]